MSERTESKNFGVEVGESVDLALSALTGNAPDWIRSGSNLRYDNNAKQRTPYLLELKKPFQTLVANVSQKVVVDVGSGNMPMYPIWDGNQTLITVDPHYDTSSKAIEGSSHVHLATIDELFSLPDRSVDIVAGFSSFHMFAYDELETYFRQFKRILKENAPVVGFESTPPWFSFLNRLPVKIGEIATGKAYDLEPLEKYPAVSICRVLKISELELTRYISEIQTKLPQKHPSLDRIEEGRQLLRMMHNSMYEQDHKYYSKFDAEMKDMLPNPVARDFTSIGITNDFLRNNSNQHDPEVITALFNGYRRYFSSIYSGVLSSASSAAGFNLTRHKLASVKKSSPLSYLDGLFVPSGASRDGLVTCDAWIAN